MRECWPWTMASPFHPQWQINIRLRDVSTYLWKAQRNIPELLAQADMVRMAKYDYEVGCFITPTPAENPMNMNFGVYIYPKLHTFHELQNPKGDKLKNRTVVDGS